jgi:AAA ATPase domain
MPVPMVGRAAAMDELRRAWKQVERGGRGVPAVVTGASGTGKSTLAAAALQAIGPAVALAGSARVHSPAPYDWLAAVLAGRDLGDVPVPPDALSWLAQHPGFPRERYTPDALLRLAVTAVRALVGAGPAVLVVDDLHALDPASLNLIAELAAWPYGRRARGGGAGLDLGLPAQQVQAGGPVRRRESGQDQRVQAGCPPGRQRQREQRTGVRADDHLRARQ